ncbi:MAG: carboxylating nicotinate-nucleotide diphosphorylase [Bacillota bacterium]|nr:carboxylating nicotinate-nucleotide diphosphorylase [Bacillota bacterium]
MHRLLYKEIVVNALAEDLGSGDWTTGSIFGEEEAEAVIVAKESGVLAGLSVAEEVFAQVNRQICFLTHFQDGEKINMGDCAASLRGPVAAILMGERVALNFLQRMSGIATATRAAVEIIRGTRAKITDTRKTTPGLRVLDKYAVRTGGGVNHRFSLADMVLIKDNHIRGAGSIGEAVARVRRHCGFPVKIEVETATLDEVKEAVDCGVDIIMLDNMTTSLMAEAVRLIAGRALVEASGGITRERLSEVAAAGVDLISLGYLTNNSCALDLSLSLL